MLSLSFTTQLCNRHIDKKKEKAVIKDACYKAKDTNTQTKKPVAGSPTTSLPVKQTVKTRKKDSHNKDSRAV